jgi:hypothetical protein
MEKFTGTKSGISCLGKAGLQGFDLGVIHEVVGALIATSRRGELAGKDGGPTWSTKDTSGVCVGKIDSALGQLINIRSDCTGSLPQTSNPIIHVVHGKKENIGPLSSRDRFVNNRKESGQDYKRFH